MTIPLIIHQIWWQGEHNISSIHNNYRKTWKQNHPKWKIILWDKIRFEKLLKNIDNIFYFYLYQTLPYRIQKIDFAKYIILYIYGGIYTDIDTICEKSLDFIIKKYNYNLIVSKVVVYKFINYNLINNGVIITSKNNVFFNYLFLEIYKNLVKKFYYTKDYYIIVSTGPICFTNAVINYVKDKNTNIKILEDIYFEPCHITDLNRYSIKGKYITHLHNSSWSSSLFKMHFNVIHLYINYKIYIIIILLFFFIILMLF